MENSSLQSLLQNIKASKQNDRAADKYTAIEVTELAKENQKAKVERLKAENDDFKQDIELRKEYAHKLYWLTVGWILAVLIIVVAQGIISFFGHKFLSDSVLITLISSTTASVLSIFLIVANYLFRTKK